VTSKLVTSTYYTYIKVFLKEAGIISIEVNITFEKHEKVLQYDPNDALNELRINED